MNRNGRALVALILPSLLFAAACGERDPMGLDPARASRDGLVFDDAWSPDVYFQQGLSGAQRKRIVEENRKLLEQQ